VTGRSPTEHEDVVEQGILGQGNHLLQAQLLTAPVEAIRAVHTDVTVVAARAILHGAQSHRALVRGKREVKLPGKKSGPGGEVEGRAPALLSVGNCSPSDARGVWDGPRQRRPRLQIFLLPPLPPGSADPGVGAPRAAPHQGNVRPALLTAKAMLPVPPAAPRSQPPHPNLQLGWHRSRTSQPHTSLRFRVTRFPRTAVTGDTRK